MPEESDTIEFVEGEVDRNRIGWYRVLEISGEKIRAQYLADGTETDLTVEVQKRILSNIRKEEKPTGAIDYNRNIFFSYIDECNKKYRYGHDLGLYRQIIDMHKSSRGIDSLLDDGSFCSLVWETLDAWNMNQRGARLVSKVVLQESIRSHRKHLNNLYQYKLQSITMPQIKHGVRNSLYTLFCGLDVMATKRRIVGVSKTMHFLLPDLVIPIDGNYTLPYFWGYNKYDNSPEAEFASFEYIFLISQVVTRRLQLTQDDVDNQGWNTSIPKLIDNAVIGYFKRLGI